MTVLRRFDCVLAATKEGPRRARERKGGKLEGDALDQLPEQGGRPALPQPLRRSTSRSSRATRTTSSQHLVSYIKGFSANVRDIFDYFEFESGDREDATRRTSSTSSSPSSATSTCTPTQVHNEQMGLIFENLIRRFNELANETAGDHFTRAR